MRKPPTRAKRSRKPAARREIDLNPVERSLVEQSSQSAIEAELAGIALDTILKGPPALNARSEPVMAMLDGASPTTRNACRNY